MSFSDTVRKAAKLGCFGEKGNLEKLEVDEEKQKGFQLASNMFFVKIIIDGKEKPLIVKNQAHHIRKSEKLYRNSHFVNEVCFYNDILPFLSEVDCKILDLFPKYYYGSADIGENCVNNAVIVEDLSAAGYRVSDLKNDLDIDHITVALKFLGKFHAFSYKAKQENFQIFNNSFTNLKEDMSAMEEFMEPGIISAPDCYKGNQSNLEKIKNFLCKNPLGNYYNSIKPIEPYAVLCHGDFCSNNILYLYKRNEDGIEKPVSVKFIDLQKCKYASPAIDLSFFLLYNTNNDMKEHWNYFLNVYYQSLSSTYDNVIVPTFNEFINDFNNHITFGIITCTYFFKVASLKGENLMNFLLLEKYEKGDFMKTKVNEEAQQQINEMLEFLVNKNYIV